MIIVYTCGTCVLICFFQMIFLTLLQQNAAHVLEVLMVLLYSLKSAEQISLYNDEEATEPKIQAFWKVLLKSKGGISSYDATAYCILIDFDCINDVDIITHTHRSHNVPSCNMLHIMLSVREKFLENPSTGETGICSSLRRWPLKSFANFTSTVDKYIWRAFVDIYYSYLMSSLYFVLHLSAVCVVFFCLSFFFCCQMWIQEGATNL